MDNTLSPVVTHSSKSEYSNTSIYSRVAQFNDDYNSDNSRNRTSSSVRIGNKKLVRNKCNSFSRYCWNWYNLFSNKCLQPILSRSNKQSCGSSGAKGLHKKLYNQLNYKLLVCLLSISTPVLAEGDTVNKSNPVAAATGNVTNQAVQFQNNGAMSRQQYSQGVSCNGSTMTFSPFYMGCLLYTSDAADE